MARHPFSLFSRHGGWSRNLIYSIISALLIVAVVVVLIYGSNPFGKNEAKTGEASPQTNEEQENEVVHLMPKLAAEPEPKPAPIDLTTKPPTESDPKVNKLIAEATELVTTEPARIIEARHRLNEALPMPMGEQQRAFVKEELSKLADEWLFSPNIFPNDTLCDIYKVKPGNQLRIIGERFKVPWEILKQINRIQRSDLLPAGKLIKVINGPFHAKIYRSTFTMDLYLQNTFVRSFPVGLGMPGRETPTGLWRVQPGGKLISPTWTDPDTGRTYRAEDPDYPLGSRWIALEGIAGAAKGRTGFAIHGTKDPDQIGTPGSRGCIRLHNGDAILVYNLLVPIFSKVEVLQ